MPFNIGPGELIVILIVALLLFGPKKLPDLGKALGESIGSFKKALNGSPSDSPRAEVASAPVRSEATPENAAVAAPGATQKEQSSQDVSAQK